MGQYFKAYSPARQSVADINYPQNGNLPHLRHVHNASIEELNVIFDYIEQTMGAEFGEYVLVGDYDTVIYRDGDESDPEYTIDRNDKNFANLVWNLNRVNL